MPLDAATLARLYAVSVSRGVVHIIEPGMFALAPDTVLQSGILHDIQKALGSGPLTAALSGMAMYSGEWDSAEIE